MKSFTTKGLLLAVALVLALVFSFSAFLYMHYKADSINWSWIALAFTVSFSSSLVLIFCVHFLLIEKLNLLLKNVLNIRSNNESEIHNMDLLGNEIDNLDIQIMAWADERKKEIEQLKKMELYRKEFLGDVSHELKTPIFNIQGYISTLLDGGLEDPSINKNYLVRADKSVDRMISIVDDLEAISQLETGELQLEMEGFDIVNLTKDVMEALELKAMAKGIMFAISEENKPFMVIADRYRIRQVLVNLIVNSIKYGKEYGETKVRFYETGKLISIEVSDNGIGISSAHLPRLFERFYRVDKSRSRDQGGTGLGLSIVKHIIEAHQQKITVSSTENEGTIFTFSLPKAYI